MILCTIIRAAIRAQPRDLRLTRQLVECSRLLELHIHDHVVIGHGRFASLAERGEL
jgi:DNA repair protein RadC